MIINDDWRLESDELQIILMHKHSKTHARSNPNSPDSYEVFYYSTIALYNPFSKKKYRGLG
jgi:hypothetical protein